MKYGYVIGPGGVIKGNNEGYNDFNVNTGIVFIIIIIIYYRFMMEKLKKFINHSLLKSQPSLVIQQNTLIENQIR